MRISTKGWYALASSINMARQYDSGEYITLLSISEKLGISKIYLEQVFSLLKRAGLVTSTKGAQGGYQLARMPEKISVLDILEAVELSLFEQSQETMLEKAPEIEKALRLMVFNALDESVRNSLKDITLASLVSEAERYNEENIVMFYI